MTVRPYTDAELAVLRDMPKTVTNPRARWSDKPRHRQRTFLAEGEDDARFSVYQRLNVDDEQDFSCGIQLLVDDGGLMLARYDGAGHTHRDIAYRPHIHRTTEAAMLAGRKPDSDASETDRFTSPEGALDCLVKDFRISGFPSVSDQQGRLLP